MCSKPKIPEAPEKRKTNPFLFSASRSRTARALSGRGAAYVPVDGGTNLSFAAPQARATAAGNQNDQQIHADTVAPKAGQRV